MSQLLNILVSDNGYVNSRAICTVCRDPLRESARWGQNSKYTFDAGPTCRPVSKSQTSRVALSIVKPSRRPPAAVTSRSEAIVVLHYCQEPTFVLGQRLFPVSIQVGLMSCSCAIAPLLVAVSFESMPSVTCGLILQIAALDCVLRAVCFASFMLVFAVIPT